MVRLLSYVLHQLQPQISLTEWTVWGSTTVIPSQHPWLICMLLMHFTRLLD